MLKKIGVVILILLTGGIGIVAYMWNKPAPKAENQDAVKIEAQVLFNAYAQNEQQANNLYLDKWVEVTGIVQSVETNQDGYLAVMLETGDLLEAVMCVMRDKNVSIEKEQKITIKGNCKGSLNGVVVKDCILIKK